MSMAQVGAAGLTNEINVTPMIDVLLVLLIIFMTAIPTMRKAIDLQLPDPKPQAAPANATSNQIVLEVYRGRHVQHQHGDGHQGSPRDAAQGDLRSASREDHLRQGRSRR